MRTVLIVDDAEINRELLKDIFEGQYHVLEAEDGEVAIEILEQRSGVISAVFLDLIMPRKNGLDVLAYMREQGLITYIPVIMITGEATTESDLKAYEFGAADIIYKPFEPRIVMRRAMNIMELYQQRLSIEVALAERTEQLRESQEKLVKNNEFLINALGSVVEFRSAESGEHVQRVSEITKVILTHCSYLYPEYRLTEEQIRMISQAAALHDVGKIAIPDAILNKPAKLTVEEFEEMKKHSVYGCEILEKFKQEDNDFYRYCYEICRWHHEKYDGHGYPDGLKGDAIPIWAQAVSVADCFDALVSKRVYKSPYAAETAYDMIVRGECGAFSEKMLNCFARAKEELFTMVETKFEF